MATCVSSSVALQSIELNGSRLESSPSPSFSPLPKLFQVPRCFRAKGLKVREDCCTRKARYIVVRATSTGEGVSSPSSSSTDVFKSLEAVVVTKNGEAVKDELDKLMEQGQTKLWSSSANISRRNTFMTELTRLGIKNAEELAIPSVRNDAVFLASVVGVTSVIAVAAGQLPGDWGFFVPYLVGSLSLVVLAVGSVAPGLFQVVFDKFSSTQGDYKERILRHEAAHFLTAYMVGLPIVDYSLDLGKEHVNLLNEATEKKIYEGLDSNLLDRLAVVSMAGLAAEGLKYDKVMGQSADLFSLQRLLNRSKQPLKNVEQQNLTRWAVYYAASLIKNNAKAYEALMEAMAKQLSVSECIKAIEQA